MLEGRWTSEQRGIQRLELGGSAGRDCCRRNGSHGARSSPTARDRGRNKKPGSACPASRPGPSDYRVRAASLAICLTWLQAGRPNHHGGCAFISQALRRKGGRQRATGRRRCNNPLPASGRFRVFLSAMARLSSCHRRAPRPSQDLDPIAMVEPLPNRDPACSTSRPMCPARARCRAASKPIKLSSNETPLGPSPKAVAAYQGRRGPISSAIRTARRRRCGRRSRAAMASIRRASSAGPARTSCISLLAHAYLGPGDEGIFTEHGFLLYRIVILAAGGDAGRGAGDAT